jgi:anthranilate phosphoribosyltransferase
MIQEALIRAVGGDDLSTAEAQAVMEEILDGRASPMEASAYISAIQAKGPTVSEVVGSARAFQKRLPPLELDPETFGVDREEIHLDEETLRRTTHPSRATTRTFNISTATLFVLAASGCRVVRTGVLSNSSYVGSEHVLRALGIGLEVTASVLGRCLREVGVGLLYTPIYHGPIRRAMEVRSRLGIRSILNLLLPLTNPASKTALCVGAYDMGTARLLAEAMREMGIPQGLVVHGEETLDEATVTGRSFLFRVSPDGISQEELIPEDLGLRRGRPEEIFGGDARENAEIIRRILDGEKGPRRDVVLLNAALVLDAFGHATDLKEGLEQAVDALDSGAAKERLVQLSRITNEALFTREWGPTLLERQTR